MSLLQTIYFTQSSHPSRSPHDLGKPLPGLVLCSVQSVIIKANPEYRHLINFILYLSYSKL